MNAEVGVSDDEKVKIYVLAAVWVVLQLSGSWSWYQYQSNVPLSGSRLFLQHAIMRKFLRLQGEWRDQLCAGDCLHFAETCAQSIVYGVYILWYQVFATAVKIIVSLGLAVYQNAEKQNTRDDLRYLLLTAHAFVTFGTIPLLYYHYSYSLDYLADQNLPWDLCLKKHTVRVVERIRRKYDGRIETWSAKKKAEFLADTEATALNYANVANCWRLRPLHYYFLSNSVQGLAGNLSKVNSNALTLPAEHGALNSYMPQVTLMVIMVHMSISVAEDNATVGELVFYYTIMNDFVSLQSDIFQYIGMAIQGHSALAKVSALLNQDETDPSSSGDEAAIGIPPTAGAHHGGGAEAAQAAVGPDTQ